MEVKIETEGLAAAAVSSALRSARAPSGSPQTSHLQALDLIDDYLGGKHARNT